MLAIQFGNLNSNSKASWRYFPDGKGVLSLSFALLSTAQCFGETCGSRVPWRCLHGCGLVSTWRAAV